MEGARSVLVLALALLLCSLAGPTCGQWSFKKLSEGFEKGVKGAVAYSPLALSPTVRKWTQTGKQESKQDQQYQAMCMNVNREPDRWNKAKLIFFSPELHSRDTLGCVDRMQLSLNVTDDQDSDQQQVLEEDTMNVKRALFESNLYDSSASSYFIVHGFLSSWNSDSWMCNTKDFILNNTRANVFIVDWSGGAKPMLPIDYAAAVSNTNQVAEQLASFIRILLELSGQSEADKFHFIGHSLGAHISGFVGYALQGSLGQITALDPAGPCFSTLMGLNGHSEQASESGILGVAGRRLSAASARLVLALHTDTGLFGLNENCAHYDIYVNGGFRQPNCTSLNPGERLASLLQFRLAETFDFGVTCAHSFAHKLLDTFDSHRPQLSQVPLLVGERKCAPMAFTCRSWDAYRLGECGLCQDRSAQCIFAGLNEVNLRKKSRAAQLANQSELTDPTIDDNNDADDEDDNENGHQSSMDSEKNKERTENPSQLVSRWRHFIRTDVESLTCLYHYQVVIGVEKPVESRAGQSKKYFYVQIPLDATGVLVNSTSGKALSYRLVQVSHAMPASLQASFAASMRSFYGSQSEAIQVENKQIHTALITFKSSLDCNKSSSVSLCAPLRGIRQLKVWSSDRHQLESVSWLALNFMSAAKESSRLRFSHLLAAGSGVGQRSDLSDSLQPNMDELPGRAGRGLAAALSSPSALISSAIRPVDCLVGALDINQRGSSTQNVKCGRADKELQYFINLKSVMAKAKHLN